MVLAGVKVFIVLGLCHGIIAIPPPAPGGPLKPETRSAAHSLLRRVSLKSRYVDHSGAIHTSRPGGYSVHVEATYGVSDHALHLAATTIGRMVRHMSSATFSRVCSLTKVGVFTKSEGLTVFPEYANLHNPAGCGPVDCSPAHCICSGSCAQSCTFDHRKYEGLAGTGGSRAVCVDDNVLCNGQDPYHKRSNILLHEFAHTIMGYALPSDMKTRIQAAYNSAKSRGLWGSGYQMANAEEYWAVGSSSFFNSEHSGNKQMNYCGGSLCTSEQAARYHIYQVDTELYNVLATVYGTEPGNLGTCTH